MQQTVILKPRITVERMQPAEYALSYTGGKLMLFFRANNATIKLKPDSKSVIQLNPIAPPSLTLTPSVITYLDWPKGAAQMEIKVSGLQKGKTSHITGSSAFDACDKANKCKKMKALINFSFTP